MRFIPASICEITFAEARFTWAEHPLARRAKLRRNNLDENFAAHGRAILAVAAG
jgi:hypothetical protein